MMCCDPREVQTPRETTCCEPDCCVPHSFVRRFVSAKEKQERLEAYKEQLEREIAGIKERLQEIKGGK
jgi:hypothetical protein